MLKKITGNVMTVMLMAAMFIGAFGAAAEAPAQAEGETQKKYTFTVTANAYHEGDSSTGYMRYIIVGGERQDFNTTGEVTATFQVDSEPTYMKMGAGTDSLILDTFEINTPNINTGGEEKQTATHDFKYFIKYKSTLTENHFHSWTDDSYSANGNVITATCQGAGTCNLEAPTLTINAEGKTYDGSAVTASLTPSDTWTSQNLGTPEITYSQDYSANAGTYTASVTKGDAMASKEFTISPLTASISWGDTSFDYDGQPHAPTANVSNLVGGDSCDVTVEGTQTAAGTHTATATELSNGNYSLPGSATTEFTINQKTLTITGVTASDKEYDGSDAAVLSGTPTLEGAVSGDDVSIDEITAVYTDGAAVGNGKAVNITATLTGEDAGNYEVTPLDTTAAITPKTVTVTKGITAKDKIYDGYKEAELDFSGAVISGKADGDELSVSGTGAFSDKTAAEDKTVTISGLTLTGTAAGNYALAEEGNQTETTASISKKPLTITGVTASDKTYDGGTDAKVDVSNVSFSGGATGDQFGLETDSASGSFDDKNAGKDKNVTVTFRLTGPDAGNYTASTKAGDVTANIRPKPVKVSGIEVYPREYDATTKADLKTDQAVFDGKEEGDVLTVSGTGTYGDINAGTDKDAAISNLSLGGKDAGNYSIDTDESQKIAQGTVTKRWLLFEGITANDKTYDGKKDAKLDFTGVKLGNVVGNDRPELDDSKFTGEFADENAGTGKTVNISITDPDTAIKEPYDSNYTLEGAGPQTTTATIKPADIKITPDDKTSQYKHDLAKLTYKVSGDYVEGDDLKVTLTTTASKTAEPGEYTINASCGNPNYNATVVPGKYTITKANATITVSGYDGRYDGKKHSITVDVEDKNLLDLLKSFFGAGGQKAEATVYYSDKEELTAENYKTAGSKDNPAYKNVSEHTVYYYIVLSDHYETVDKIAGSKTVKITKAPLTIKADPKSKKYGKKDPKLTYKLAGVVKGEEKLIKVALKRDPGEKAGTYRIKAKSIKATGNYDVTYVPADFVIRPVYEGSRIIGESINRNDPPRTTATNLEKIARRLLTDKEWQAVKDGAGAMIWIDVAGFGKGSVPSADRAKLEDAAKKLGLTPARWMDISLFKDVTGFGVTQIHDTAVPVELVTEVPRDLRKDGRVFYMLRCHKGHVSTLASTSSDRIYYSSDGFSTYMLAYKDTKTKGAATGDTNDIAGPAALMLASAGMLGAIVLRRRKKVK